MRVPLRFINFTKALPVGSAYTDTHDTFEHDKPKGLRLVLDLSTMCVVISAPANEKCPVTIRRVPFSGGMVQWIEDLLPESIELTAEEKRAAVQRTVDRMNQREADAIQPAKIAERPKDQGGDDESFDNSSKIGEITIGTTMTEEEQEEDEAADEAATTAEQAKAPDPRRKTAFENLAKANAARTAKIAARAAGGIAIGGESESESEDEK